MAGSATAATLATIATVASVASVAAGALTIASVLTAKKPTAQASGSQTQFSADPDAGIPLVIGRTGNASDIVFRRGWDTADQGDNDRQAFVAVHSIGPIDAVEGFTVDRSPVTFDGAGRAIGAFAGFMWMVSQLGATPEPTALTFGADAGTPPGWTADHKLSGKAASAWTLRFDTKAKLYQNGVPAPMWTIRGIKAYDPRKDSTYPGGSGPHRMADPADTAAYDAAVDTWEWTEDPYLIGLRWAHGIWQRDRSDPASFYQRVMGMGAPWATIDVPAFVEGANIALANEWKVGGVIYSGDGKWDGMKKILQAGMGEPLTLGARISCLVNAPKVSLATITVDDLVGPGSVSATQPRRDRVNTITPRLRLEENNWQLLPAAPISVPEHVVEDRGKRSRVQDYPFIQQTNQAAVAARYDIENAREFGPISLPLKLVWMGYKPGDCVTAILPELGLNGQPVLLLNRELSPATGIVTMTARSETAAKHPFALGQTTTPPPTPGVSGPPLVPAPGENAWSIVASKIEAGGATVPAIVVAGAVDVATAETVVIEYRRFVSGQSPDAGWLSAGIFEPTLTVHPITAVQSGSPYEVGISYQRRGITGPRRIIGPATTAGSALDFNNVTGPNKPQNGATVGAPDGTMVGNKLAQVVVSELGLAGNLGFSNESWIKKQEGFDPNTGYLRSTLMVNYLGIHVAAQTIGAGPGGSFMAFRASNFYFYDDDNSNGTPILSWEATRMTWRMPSIEVDTIKALSIETEALNFNSVNYPYWAELGSDLVMAKNTDVFALTITVPNVQVGELLKIVGSISLFSTNDLTGSVIVQHTPPSGAAYDLRRQPMRLDSDGNTSTFFTLPVIARHVAAQAGTHVFKLGYNASGVGNFSFKAGTEMEVTRQKR